MSEENAVVEAPEADDFNAGFDGQEAPTTTPEAEPEPEVTAPAEPEPEPEPAPDPLAELRAELAEIKARESEFHNKVSKAYGEIGGLKQKLGEIQHGGLAELSDEDVADVRNEYGEEMAAMLKSLINKSASKRTPAPVKAEEPAPVPTIDLETLKQEAKQEALRVRLEAAIEDLKEEHPDWEEVRASEEFAAWSKSQPEERQKRIATSQSAKFAAKILTEFKETQKKKAVASTSRQKRFEAAVTPKGTGGSAPAGRTDEDEFLAGFNG